jgi:hypothetical protein
MCPAAGSLVSGEIGAGRRLSATGRPGNDWANSTASAWALSVWPRRRGSAMSLSRRRPNAGDRRSSYSSSRWGIATNLLELRREPNRQTWISDTELLSGDRTLGTTVMLTKMAAFDPETVSLLGAVLDQAIAALPPDDRSQERKTLLASKQNSQAIHRLDNGNHGRRASCCQRSLQGECRPKEIGVGVSARQIQL